MHFYLLTEINRQPTKIENFNRQPTKWLNFNRQATSGPPHSDPPFQFCSCYHGLQFFCLPGCTLQFSVLLMLRPLSSPFLFLERESVGTVQNRSSTYQPGLWNAKYNDIIIPSFKYSSPYSSFTWSSRASQRSLKFFPRLERMLVWNEPGSKILTFTPQGYISRLNASEKASTPYLATL